MTLIHRSFLHFKEGTFFMNHKVKQVLNKILKAFKTGEIPYAVAMASYPVSDIPCATWSLLNRTLIHLALTTDARGIKQWNKINRKIKKGSKAIYIIVPYHKKEMNPKTDEELLCLKGFIRKPVFRVEDTEGDPIKYQRLKMPGLPLIERANEWDISVKAIPGNRIFYGSYLPTEKKIYLASPEEKVFFHELSHAAHEKILGSLQLGQHPIQEIVAELSAAALCVLVGTTPDETMGNSYLYIKAYASKIKMNPYMVCVKVLSDTEKVLNLILRGSKNVEHSK